MVEIRHAEMCDPTADVQFRPSQYIPQLQSLFGAFTVYVERQLPHALEAFRHEATSRFRDLAEHGEQPRDSSSPRDLLPDPGPDPDAGGDLERARLDYVCRLLGVRAEDLQTVRSVTRFAVTQARLYPAFYQMQALCDVVGRDKAMPLLHRFIDTWMAENTRTDTSLQDPSRFWDALDAEHHETTETAVRLDRGRIAFRVNRCLWAEVMRPLNDPELAHVGTCYGDFPQVAAIHPSFVLTRTMTLMQGAPYCDTCIHDRRHVDSIEHPDRSLFDSLDTDR